MNNTRENIHFTMSKKNPKFVIHLTNRDLGTSQIINRWDTMKSKHVTNGKIDILSSRFTKYVNKTRKELNTIDMNDVLIMSVDVETSGQFYNKNALIAFGCSIQNIQNEEIEMCLF